MGRLRPRMVKHRPSREEGGRLGGGGRPSLRDLLIAWARDRLEKEIQERLNREDTELMERVYSRELDPISASERIFKEV